MGCSATQCGGSEGTRQPAEGQKGPSNLGFCVFLYCVFLGSVSRSFTGCSARKGQKGPFNLEQIAGGCSANTKGSRKRRNKRTKPAPNTRRQKTSAINETDRLGQLIHHDWIIRISPRGTMNHHNSPMLTRTDRFAMPLT